MESPVNHNKESTYSITGNGASFSNT
jgi:hypothetical protein